MVGKVYEAADLLCSGGSLLRLLLSEARRVECLDSERGGTITVQRDSPELGHHGMLLISCEATTLVEVHCEVIGSAHVFTYV